jgi:hypothetical protein
VIATHEVHAKIVATETAVQITCLGCGTEIIHAEAHDTNQRREATAIGWKLLAAHYCQREDTQ